MTADIDSSDTSPSAARWHRLAFTGLSVCLGFFGLVNLASLAATHGFEWHGIVRELVNGYHNTVFPIYGVFLGPLSRYLHIQISQTEREIVTAVLLGLIAANAESLARDGRPIVVTIFKMLRELTSWEKGDGPAGSKNFVFRGQNFLTRSLPAISLIVFLPFAIIVAIGGVGTIWTLPFSEHSVTALLYREIFPRWIYWGLRHWYIGIAATALAVALGSRFEDTRIATTSFGLVVKTICAAVGIVGMLPFFILIIVPFAAGLLVSGIIIAMLAPLIAWRTVSATLLAFCFLLLANWASTSGVI